MRGSMERWRILLDAGWWTSVAMMVLLGVWVAGTVLSCDFIGPTRSERAHTRAAQASRPNTDARGERLCAEHGGYEGYAAVGVRGAWLLCFDGTEFRTFHTGPVDRWVNAEGTL